VSQTPPLPAATIQDVFVEVPPHHVRVTLAVRPGRVSGRATVLAALVALSGCTKDGAPTEGRTPTAGLSVQASVVSAAATSIRFVARTTADATLILGQQSVTLGSAASQVVPLRLDLTQCLARLAPASPCPVRLEVSLLDGAGAQLDQVVTNPVDVRPFETAVVPGVIQLREVNAVTVTPSPVSLVVGGTRTMAAALTDATGAAVTGRTVTWGSSNNAVATVSAAGLVTAVTPGTATITATGGGRSGTSTVTVSAPPTITLSNPGPVLLTAVSGQSTVVTLSISVANGGGGTLGGLSSATAYVGSPPAPWLTATLGSATAPTSLTLLANASRLPAGTFDADVTVQSSVAGVTSRTVRVRVTVAPPPPALALAVDTLYVTHQIGTNPPQPQSVPVTNTGVGTITGLSAVTTYLSKEVGWLRATIGGATPTFLSVDVTPFNLLEGTYAARVDVRTSIGGIAPRVLIVILHVVLGERFDCAVTDTFPYFPPAAAQRISPSLPFTSGSSGTWVIPYNLGVRSQVVRVEWDHASEPDAINVCFRGLNVFDTGNPVTGTGAFNFNYPGSTGTSLGNGAQSIFLYVVIRAPLRLTTWRARALGVYDPPPYPVPPDSLTSNRVGPAFRGKVRP